MILNDDDQLSSRIGPETSGICIVIQEYLIIVFSVQNMCAKGKYERL